MGKISFPSLRLYLQTLCAKWNETNIVSLKTRHMRVRVSPSEGTFFCLALYYQEFSREQVKIPEYIFLSGDN